MFKRIVLAFVLFAAFVAGLVAPNLSGPGIVQAAGCSATPNTPYNATGGFVYGYSGFYCNDGRAHKYETCIVQDGIVKDCASVTTTTYAYSVDVRTCWIDSVQGVFQTRTRASVYNDQGALILRQYGSTGYTRHCN